MPLEKVVEEIISQAETGKVEIINQGRTEARKILEEAENKSKSYMKKFDEETNQLLEDTKKMELSAFNIELSRKILTARKDILNELFAKLEEKIKSMDQPTRKSIIKNLLDKTKKELPDAYYAYTNEKDKKLVSSDFKIGGAIDCLGGVIVENKERSLRQNYTFEIFLQKIKETHINDIAKRLFK